MPDLNIWAHMVRLIHFIFVIFLVYAVCSSDWKLNTVAAIIIPSLLVHWYCNNDICCLTELEKFLTNKPGDATFIGSIISPVYRVENKQIKMTTYALWIIVLIKLFLKRNLIFLELSE
jgi:hypothetical protein